MIFNTVPTIYRYILPQNCAAGVIETHLLDGHLIFAVFGIPSHQYLCGPFTLKQSLQMTTLKAVKHSQP